MPTSHDPNPHSSKPMGKTAHRGHAITTHTIKSPPFSYLSLELMPAHDAAALASSPLDALTVHRYVGLALSQFLGLAGTAVPIDILRVDGRECWLRVAHGDLGLVRAAVGGWTGPPGCSEAEGKVGWKITASGRWLGLLVAQKEAGHVWET